MEEEFYSNERQSDVANDIANISPEKKETEKKGCC